MTRSENGAARQPDEAEIRAALDRIVASSHLNKSPQLATFLRFVVEQSLAGQSDRIKAYTIAADALGRDASFDPQQDPIVRVEAGRLRRALDHYYTDGGCDDPVVIELPRGGYVPVFRTNSTPRRALARLTALRRRAAMAWRQNSQPVLLIVVIAVAVSLTVEVLRALVPQ